MKHTAEQLILELASLEPDSNDDYGDVIIDGTTDLFTRIKECAAQITKEYEQL